MTTSTQENALGEKYQELITTLCEISEANYFLGKLDEAIALLESNRLLFDNANVPLRARIKLSLQHVKLLINRGGLNNSLDADEETILGMLADMRQVIVDEDLLAEALHLTGLLYYWQLFEADNPDVETPLRYFTQAYEIRKKLDDKRGICESLFYLGLICQIFRQEIDQAEKYYTQALEIADTHQFKLEKSYIVRHIGFIYEAREDFTRAKQSLEQSLSLREEVGFKIYFPFSHLSLGDLAMTQNDLVSAEKHFQLTLDLAEEMGLSVQKVHALLALAQLRVKQEESAQARQYGERAQAISNEIQFKYGITESTGILSNLTNAA